MSKTLQRGEGCSNDPIHRIDGSMREFMRSRLTFWAGSSFALLALLCSGCGGQSDVHEFTITVKCNGRLVSAGTVVATPQWKSGEGSSEPVGATGELYKGRADFTTFEEEDGLLIGKHKLTITPADGVSNCQARTYDIEVTAETPDRVFELTRAR